MKVKIKAIIIISIICIVLVSIAGSLTFWLQNLHEKELGILTKLYEECLFNETDNICAKERCSTLYNNNIGINYQRLLEDRYRNCLLSNLKNEPSFINGV